MSEKTVIVHTSGKRKRSVARATIKKGKGRITVNNKLLDVFQPKICRMKIIEPLLIAGDLMDGVDINLNMVGGGIVSQADAARLALGRGIVKYSKSNKLKEQFLEYDRHLLVADVRRKEPCKPNDSKARAKRQKSYR